MLYIVAFLVLVGILMIPHEWGHYFVARLAGMKVYEYSIGVGPEVFSRTRNDVKFSLRPIPLAAYVRIAGMEPGETDHPDGFGSKSIPWRFAVLIAGSTMNMVVAFIVFVIVGMTFGKVVATTSTVKHVDRDMPGFAAGFQVGDVLTAVNGKKIKDTDEFIATISALPGKTATVTVLRTGKVTRLTVVPRAVEEKHKRGKTGDMVTDRIGRIGLQLESSPIYRRVGIVESIEAGCETTAAWTGQIVVGTVYILTHKEGLKSVGGPVAIARAAGDSAKRGVGEFAWFVGVVSINLAIFNLLPLLALDGGRIMFLVYEAVRRRPVDPKKEFIANAVGMAFLLLLAVIITAKDIRDWIVK